MWDTSWINFNMDLATIDDPSIKNKPEGRHIAPEDEEAELRKELLGL